MRPEDLGIGGLFQSGGDAVVVASVAAPEQLADAVRRARDGEFPFDRKLAMDLLRSVADREKAPTSPSGVEVSEDYVSEPLTGGPRFYASSRKARSHRRSRVSSS